MRGVKITRFAGYGGVAATRTGNRSSPRPTWNTLRPLHRQGAVAVLRDLFGTDEVKFSYVFPLSE
jgi:hypothetical protein